jgi:hypothetical protein
LLVSAAHVFDRQVPAGDEIYYYTQPGVIRQLTGKLVSSPGRSKRSSDLVDVACLLLDGDGLPPYPTISKFAVDKSYLAPRHLPRSGREYVTIGFPATKANVDDRHGTALAAPYAYRTASIVLQIDDSAYSSFGFTPGTHVVLPFDSRRGFDHLRKEGTFPEATRYERCARDRIVRGR